MAKFEITWLEDRSDEAVLEEIRRVAALEPASRLTVDRFDAVSRIKSNAVRERFGSWSEATRRAGLTDALPVYSDDAIIEDLKRVSDSSPHESFTSAFYSTRGKYSCSCIKRRFGGWREALDAAGLGGRFIGPPTTERMKSQPGRAMSDEEILAKIRDVSMRLGKASLAGADIEANSEITQNLMYRRFGSASAALRQAGVEQASHGRRHTEDEVFENLLKVWTHYGRAPTVSEMDLPPSTVGKHTYLHRYGGWRKALKAFVGRANSEADGDPTLNPEKEPPALVERTGPAESLATNAIAVGMPQSASQITTRSRVARLTSTNVQPEDRRDPSIGLRFKVLQRDRFKCVLCGDHPARNAECILHVDHLIPWSRGGKTREDNLRTLCAICNIGRGNRFGD
jgi:5-methylcytosine-specific restriction endonuclease McrA